MSRKLEGKIAVVTGGSSGIGLASAKRFVEEGASVFITGRRGAELERAKAEIGGDVTTIQGDIASLEDIDRLYATVAAEKGQIDVLVANAGFVEAITSADATPEHFDKTFGINARGTFFTVQKALPLLKDGASIILVSSCVQYKGIPHYVVYSGTKAAMRAFARCWAMELKERNIRVNTLSPGPVETPIIDLQFKTKEEADATRAQFASMMPLGRMGTADEMANCVLFLASDDSSYVTAFDLIADAGFTQV